MAFVLLSKTLILEEAAADFRELIAYLQSRGLTPLISTAKAKAYEVFGVTHEQVANAAGSGTGYTYILGELGTSVSTSQPSNAELFNSKDRKSLLFVATGSGNDPEGKSHKILDIGLIGQSDARPEYESLIAHVGDFVRSKGAALSWVTKVPTHAMSEFTQAGDVKFLAGSQITDVERRLSAKLEDARLRKLALLIKSSGGILGSDLLRKGAAGVDDPLQAMTELENAGLVSTNYVVICKRTSNQVARLLSKDKVAEIAKLGVSCSCGNQIANERIEDLIVPAAILEKMLTQSYWMSARLVTELESLGVDPDKILLNLQDSPEEIDAFVDVEDTLLMFELKDAEFSMGHAYSFGARIAMYKPAYAVMVSTKGIGPEVREHFKKIKPASEVIYVSNLAELKQALADVVQKVRSTKAGGLLENFERFARFEIPLNVIAEAVLGVKVEKKGLELGSFWSDSLRSTSFKSRTKARKGSAFYGE
ncbi:MAG TPA: hypothetical protein VES66_09650 [Terriglobales bacterium]|nr:hypothetical protein [Terriglobales bacterium]